MKKNEPLRCYDLNYRDCVVLWSDGARVVSPFGANQKGGRLVFRVRKSGDTRGNLGTKINLNLSYAAQAAAIP